MERKKKIGVQNCHPERVQLRLEGVVARGQSIGWVDGEVRSLDHDSGQDSMVGHCKKELDLAA